MNNFEGKPASMIHSPSETSASSKRPNYLLYLSFVIFAVVIIEFVVTPLIQQRSQRQLVTEFKQITAQAAAAFGQAGVTPLPDTAPAYGSPVALIQIPKIGLTQVVVEGIDGVYTQSGPGHAPGTVLPGQAGESVIVGRRTTFGAPFYNIGHLKAGDQIKVVTIEGPSVYKVVNSQELATAGSTNVLKLYTSNPPVIATSSKVVVAQLEGNPYPLTPKNSRTSPGTNQLALMLLLVVGLSVILWFSRRIFARYGSVVGWLLVIPVVGGALVALTLAIDTILPATI